MKKAVVFGAGNIGRGFLGQLFFESGYETVFVEAAPSLVALLNEKKSYPLWIMSDEETRKIEIGRVRAVPAWDKKAVAGELKKTDVCAVAVGVRNLKKVAPLVAAGVAERARSGISQPLNVLVCENLRLAAKVFEAEIKENLAAEFYPYFDEKIGLVETVVSRMVPTVPEALKEKEPLLVLAESYKNLPVARSGFKGEIPAVAGFLPVENINAYEELKLYIHNMMHAVCAYVGYLKGYRYIWEAVDDPEIRRILDGASAEINEALIKKYHFLSGELRDYGSDLFKRFANTALGDTVFRGGRQPLRKLGSSDRLVGAARLCLDFGINPKHVLFALAAALRYNYKDDEEARDLAKMVSEKGAGYVLQEICRIRPDEPIYTVILENFKNMEML